MEKRKSVKIKDDMDPEAQYRSNIVIFDEESSRNLS